jgi:diguanylate cyclase (GGDEF)-like protein
VDTEPSVESPIRREVAFPGQRLRRKVASALLLSTALPLLILAYSLYSPPTSSVNSESWLLEGATISALLVFTALLMAGAAAVVWDLTSAVSRLAAGVRAGRIPEATPRSDEIGTLVTSFARMAATIERQAQEISQLPLRLDQLTRQAFQDPLTSLPNRALFLDRLKQGLARAERHRRAVSVLFMDLDRFKLINDSLGHSAGDEFLVEVGRRLRACLRDEDTIARLGGDEFGILIEEVTNLSGPIGVAERITDALGEPFTFAGREVALTASIGIAMTGTSVVQAEELLRQADLAMYRAKAEGRARHEVFHGSMEAPALERLDLEMDLRRALERRELRLYYQPVVALATGHITEAEALIRWSHSQRGLILPAEFIHVLEDAGLMVAVGRWVLGDACRQAAAWQAELNEKAPIISVNLSPKQLQASTLVDDVASALREAGLTPDRLKLEVAESATMADAPVIIERLHALKKIGVRLAIDDFGIGSSSLARLKRLPVDTIKIDRSLIRGLLSDPVDTAIVSAVVTLAQGLRMMVTAEGVESYDQVVQLQGLGCGQAQGYYFAHPLPPARLRVLLSMSRNGSSGWSSSAQAHGPFKKTTRVSSPEQQRLG